MLLRKADIIELLGSNLIAPRFPNGIAATMLGSGNGGNVQIQAQELHVTEGATITTGVQGNREATARLFNSAFNNPFYDEIADQPDAGTGNAGNIDINAARVQVSGVYLVPNAPTQPKTPALRAEVFAAE